MFPQLEEIPSASDEQEMEGIKFALVNYPNLIFMQTSFLFRTLLICAGLINISLLSGQTYFQKVFTAPYDQEAQDVLPTADGGYIFVGYTTTSIVNDCDVLIIKADASGNEVWRKTYGGNKPDFPYHFTATTDGNYMLAGYSYSYGGGDMDILVIKFDPSGAVLWSKTYGGNGNDMGRDVIPTSDGNYMIVGSSNSPGLADQNANLIKIDGAGTVLWSKVFGTTSADFGNCVKQTSDGGYVMIGQTFGYGTTEGAAWLVKLDGNGDTTWTKRFDGAHNDEGYYITVASDGGYVFLVRDSSNAGQDIDARIIKTDASGNVVWNKVYGGNRKDTPKMIQNTSDGGYIVGAISRSFGWINPDMWILKCNSAGDTTWTRHYGGSQNEHCYVVRELPDGSYIACGKTASYGPDLDPIFLKLSPNGTLVGLNDIAYEKSSIDLYPNPSNGKFTVAIPKYSVRKISIIDVLGREITQRGVTKGEELITIDFSESKPGVYFLLCEAESTTSIKKFIIH